MRERPYTVVEVAPRACIDCPRTTEDLMNDTEAMIDKVAAESAIGVAAAFDEGLRYPSRPSWRVVYLAARLHCWPNSDFRRAEILGRLATYAAPRREDS